MVIVGGHKPIDPETNKVSLACRVNAILPIIILLHLKQEINTNSNKGIQNHVGGGGRGGQETEKREQEVGLPRWWEAREIQKITQTCIICCN